MPNNANNPGNPGTPGGPGPGLHYTVADATTGAVVGWWDPVVQIFIPTIETAKCHAKIAEIYEEINTFFLVSEKDKNPEFFPMDESVLTAIRRATTEYQDQFEPKAIAELNRRVEELTALRGLSVAHRNVSNMLVATVRVREQDITNLAASMQKTLKEKADAGIRSGRIDSRAMGAWEIINSAKQKVEEKVHNNHLKLNRATEDLRDANSEQAKLLVKSRERIGHLENEVVQLRAEIQRLSSMAIGTTTTSKPKVQATNDPNDERRINRS